MRISSFSRRTTEISATVRQIRDKAIAVADGTMEEVVDDRTGEVREREQWHWLPRAAIEVEGYAIDDRLVGRTVTIVLPESMAKAKGLI